MAPSSIRSDREWVRDGHGNFRHNLSIKDFRNLKVWEKAHQLAARDLKLIQPGHYQNLLEQTVEIKRMLTVLAQQLTAES